MSGTITWNPEDALILVRVVEEESFTRAAQVLELPKSSVSRRVSRLEDALGVQLLRRTTRRLSLTEAGQAFYGRAREAVESLVAAECAATSTLDEPRGRLRVTAPAELGTRTFEAMLEFSRAHPQVHLDIDLTNRYVNLIEEGYDAALRGGQRPEGALTGRSLGGGNVVVVASPDYLRQRGTPKRTRDLVQHDAILFPRWVTKKASNWTWQLTGPKGKVAVPIEGRLSLTNLEAVRVAALRGHGIAMLPEGHCARDLAEGTLTRLLPRYVVPGVGLWIVYPRSRFRSTRLQAFVQAMLEALGD